MQPHQPPAPARTNTVGALSFVFGALGILAALVGFALPGILLGFVGVVCGIVGLAQASKLGGTGISIAGLLVAGAAVLGGLAS